MASYDPDLVELFRTKASAVNAVIHEVPTLADAIPYVVNVCANKAPCELLSDEPGVETGPLGPNGVPTRVRRIVAAPDLDGATFALLEAACAEKGFLCLRGGLREHLAGMDVGLTHAILGVAESGTCMVNTDSEDVRLAGMVVETSMLVLRKSAVYRDLPGVAAFLRERQKDGRISYTTFITGPSRTADIERVGAIGVHGPLELHVILLED